MLLSRGHPGFAGCTSYFSLAFADGVGDQVNPTGNSPLTIERVEVKETAKLLVSCPDRPGLVARISDFVFRNGGNFLHFDQHTDVQAGVFLARAEWELDGFQIPRERIGDCFQGIALECGMQFELIFSDQVPKIAILVSKLPHCLQDLLLRHQAGEFERKLLWSSATTATRRRSPVRLASLQTLSHHGRKQASTGDR